MINSQVKTTCLESDLCYILLMKRVWDCRLGLNLPCIVTDNVLEFRLKGYTTHSAEDLEYGDEG